MDAVAPTIAPSALLIAGSVAGLDPSVALDQWSWACILRESARGFCAAKIGGF